MGLLADRNLCGRAGQSCGLYIAVAQKLQDIFPAPGADKPANVVHPARDRSARIGILAEVNHLPGRAVAAFKPRCARAQRPIIRRPCARADCAVIALDRERAPIPAARLPVQPQTVLTHAGKDAGTIVLIARVLAGGQRESGDRIAKTWHVQRLRKDACRKKKRERCWQDKTDHGNTF